MAGKGSISGERRGGRTMGVPNKVTQERALQAERDVREAKAAGRKLGKEILDELANIFLSMAARAQPIPDGVPVPAGRKPDPGEFERWSRLAMDCAAKLAPFQSPTFRAIMVASEALPAPIPVVAPGAAGQTQRMSAMDTYRAMKDGDIVELRPIVPRKVAGT